MKDFSKNSPYRVQVLDRALGILELLWSDGPELTLIEVCERLELHKSTVHRLLGVLEQHRFVEKSPVNGKYCLGLKLFELGSAAVRCLDIRGRAQRHLEHLVAETGETAHLCILDDGEVLYLEKVEVLRTVRVPSIVGRPYPAHCGAAGKSLLAFLSDDELEESLEGRELKAYTPNTMTTLAELRREMQLVRERGYAVDNEEFEEGLECIGAPIRDHSGKVVAAVSIAGPTSRMNGDKVPLLANSVMRVANELSTELGYHGVRLKVSTVRGESTANINKVKVTV